MYLYMVRDTLHPFISTVIHTMKSILYLYKAGIHSRTYFKITLCDVKNANRAILLANGNLNIDMNLTHLYLFIKYRL